jgi:hypothetical protein
LSQSKKDAVKKGKGDTGLVSEIKETGNTAKRRNYYAAKTGASPI